MPAKKRPRNVYLGPSDYCKNTYQKQKYIKSLSGEVKTYNMINAIVKADDLTVIDDTKSFEEIKAMPKDKARDYLIALRELHSVQVITAHWNILSEEHFYNAKLYKIFHDFGVPVKTERMAKAHKVRNQLLEAGKLNYVNKDTNPNILIFDTDLAKQSTDIITDATVKSDDQKLAEATAAIEATIEAKYKAMAVVKKKKTSFTINLEGEFDGTTLSQKLNGICQLMGNDKTYNVVFVVEESNDEAGK